MVYWSQKHVFPGKSMQNHLETSSINQCWNRFVLFHNTFFVFIIVFDLQTIFFDGKTVFFRFLAEIRLRTLIKPHQKASSRPKTCKFCTTCTLPWATVWDPGPSKTVLLYVVVFIVRLLIYGLFFNIFQIFLNFMFRCQVKWSGLILFSFRKI